jgi:hypothetical protein
LILKNLPLVDNAQNICGGFVYGKAYKEQLVSQIR